MANNITLRKEMVTILDEVFKNASLTSVLDTNTDLVRAGANAKEIMIPKIDMDGLADYNRNTGYADGNVALVYETKTFSYDRGRKFAVDRLDNEESGDLAFGRLAGEFIRNKVVPEVDAYRICEYAKKAGKAKVETLTTGKQVVTALREATNAMDEAEVPQEGRILFITPSIISMVEDMDTTASREVLGRFSQIIRVPQSRMNMNVVLTANGFTVEKGNEINFLAVVPQAVLQIPKHAIPKVKMADDNIDMDADVYTYRTYQMAETLDNKTAGIYVSKVKA